MNTTRIEALRLKMQRWPPHPRAGLGFCTSPHLSSTLHPGPNPKQVAGHLRARTGRTTISSGHGHRRRTNVTPNPPSRSQPRTRTPAADQAFQVYQRLVAQLGNAVDEWAAAADVEQGVQAALHVVQQVAVRAAIAGMLVVIEECPLPLAMWITDQARAEAAEVTASTAARASARAVTGALSS